MLSQSYRKAMPNAAISSSEPQNPSSATSPKGRVAGRMPTVSVFQDATHGAVAYLDALRANMKSSNDADQCVTGSPTSVGGRQASASIRAASASERENQRPMRPGARIRHVEMVATRFGRKGRAAIARHTMPKPRRRTLECPPRIGLIPTTMPHTVHHLAHESLIPRTRRHAGRRRNAGPVLGD
jgi:hypothetical protein